MRRSIRVGTALVTVVCLLCACGKTAPVSPAEENVEETQVEETEDPQEETDTADESEGEDTVGSGEVEGITLTADYDSIEKTEKNDEGYDETIFMTTYETLKLSDEDSEKYPQLASTIAKMNEDIVAGAKKTHEEDSKDVTLEDWEYGSYSYSSYIRSVRTDSSVVSLLDCIYEDTGGAHGTYFASGTNIDVNTGNEIQLTDVVSDVDKIIPEIEKVLKEKYSDQLYDPEEDHPLKEYKIQELNWVITYDGIGFLFNQYEVAPYASGVLECDIPFTEEEFFTGKYTQIPRCRVQVIPLGEEYTTDLDGDGKPETTEVTAEFGDYSYTKVIVSFNGKSSKSEDPYSYEINPVLMQAEDGNNYLYLENLSDNDYRYITIYHLDYGKVEKVGEFYAGFYDNIIPGTTKEFYLTSWLELFSTYNGYKKYHINPAGMPEEDVDYYTVVGGPQLTVKKDIKADVMEVDPQTGDVDMDSRREETITKGTKLNFYHTDNKTYADMKIEGEDRVCRLVVTSGSGYETKVNGKKLSKYFDGIVFAG